MDFTGNCPNAHSIFGTDHYSGASDWGDIQHAILGNLAYTVAPQRLGNVQVVLQDAVPGTIPAGTTVTTQSRNNLAIRRDTQAPEHGLFAYNLGSDRRAFQSRDQWTDSRGPLQNGTHTTDNGTKPLQQFQNGLLQLDATSQPSFGAWLKHCYREDRSLDTSCSLWPWPMNQRMQQALRQSSYAERGLDGAGETDLTALILRLTGSKLTGQTSPRVEFPAPRNLRIPAFP
jgi:hypothetical protein